MYMVRGFNESCLEVVLVITLKLHLAIAANYDHRHSAIQIVTLTRGGRWTFFIH